MLPQTLEHRPRRQVYSYISNAAHLSTIRPCKIGTYTKLKKKRSVYRVSHPALSKLNGERMCSGFLWNIYILRFPSRKFSTYRSRLSLWALAWEIKSVPIRRPIRLQIRVCYWILYFKKGLTNYILFLYQKGLILGGKSFKTNYIL